MNHNMTRRILTPSLCRQLLVDFTNGVPALTLADKYGLHATSVYRLLDGQSYKDIQRPIGFDAAYKEHRHYKTKLTPEQRAEAAALYLEGNLTYAQVGKRFGVSAPAVCHYVKGRAAR